MNISLISRFASILLWACILVLSTRTVAQVSLVPAFPDLTFASPIGIQNAGDGSDRMFVVERRGVIKVFPNTPSVTSTTTFLDIADSVRSGGELGLLGLAFHPNFESNGYFYVNYTRGTLATGTLRSTISRFQVSPTNPDSAVRSSQVVLFDMLQPYENHNGGDLAFGPDGFLYIALGDGGSGGDPQNNGQKLTTLLGKILRINVDSTQAALQYAIPATNPFAGNTSGYREEIYAYGLRNPWRFSFDHPTGRLWCADVGQNAWEEIDTVINGGNYGWRIMEGKHCYNPSVGCNTTGLKLPVYEYSHDTGCSITGGYVYRGSGVPSLHGLYIYTDFCEGDIFSLDIGGGGPPLNRFVLSSGQSVTSFGVDEANELYLCNIYSGKLFTFKETSPPLAPVLLAPANGETAVGETATMRWQRTGIGHTANIIIATDPTFQQIVVNDSLLVDTTYAFVAPPLQTTFFWKVRGKNSFGYGPYSDSWSFSTQAGTVTTMQIRKAWNMISLPLAVTDSLKTTVFPTAASEAFSYSPSSGYSQSPFLQRGKGYWLKFPQDDTLALYGIPFNEDSISVEAGWNVVGAISAPIVVSAIVQEPADNIVSAFYGYGGGYSVSTQLLPGRAYWVKVQSAGVLILRAP